jgi:hypothetical protein
MVMLLTTSATTDPIESRSIFLRKRAEERGLLPGSPEQRTGPFREDP